MNRTISIIHPSRNRAEMALSVANKWITTAGCQVQYILSLDTDEKEIEQYKQCNDIIQIVQHNNKSAIEAINVAVQYTTGDILIVVSDDFDCPDNWAIKLLEQIGDKKDIVVKTQDGTQPWIMTLPIMDRTYYNRFGYIYYPGYQHMFCLSADTQIFMGDYSFKEIKDIKEGEIVIGSEKRKSKKESYLHYLCRTNVTQVHKKKDELFLITLESGKTVKSTKDHLWGIYNYNDQLDYNVPKEETTLMHVIDLPGKPPTGLDWERGWLAGMWDGEGCFEVITQSPVHNPIITKKIEDTLNKLGFRFSMQDTIQRGKFKQRMFTLLGGKSEYLKFYNWVNPFKINQKRADKRVLTTRFGKKDKIVKMESLGIQDVYCLTTESKNFVADGYLSHNCDTEMSHVGDLLGKTLTIPITFPHKHYTTGAMKKDSINEKNDRTWTQGETLYLKRVKENFGIENPLPIKLPSHHINWLKSKGIHV